MDLFQSSLTISSCRHTMCLNKLIKARLNANVNLWVRIMLINEWLLYHHNVRWGKVENNECHIESQTNISVVIKRVKVLAKQDLPSPIFSIFK